MKRIIANCLIFCFVSGCSNNESSTRSQSKPQPTTESISKNAIINEQSNTGNKFITLKGFIIDGPLDGATVFIDSNNNGIREDNETVVKTGEDGSYQIDTEQKSDFYIVAYGGINISTGKDFEGKLGRYVSLNDIKETLYITPLTTLISEYKRNHTHKPINEIKEKISMVLNMDIEDLDKNPMDHTRVFLKSNLVNQSVEIINGQLSYNTEHKTKNYQSILSKFTTLIDRSDKPTNLSDLSSNVIHLLNHPKLLETKDSVQKYIQAMESLSVDSSTEIKANEIRVNQSLLIATERLIKGKQVDGALDRLSVTHIQGQKSDNEKGTQNTKEIPITDNHTQTDNTKRINDIAYAINVNLHDKGKIIPNLPENLLDGQSMTFTVNPDENVKLISINISQCSSASVSQNEIIIHHINADCSIDVQFKRLFTINTDLTGRGTLLPDNMEVLAGKSATFNIDLPSYTELAISGCGGSVNGAQFHIAAVNEDCIIRAEFNELHKPSQPFLSAEQEINVQGSFQGHIKFVQNHMVTTQEDIDGMHLVGLRPTLLIFKPKAAINELIPVKVKAYKNEILLGEVELSRPHYLPRPYVIDQNIMAINFDIDESNLFVLNQVGDAAMKEALDNHDIVRLTMKNGFYKSKGLLPEGNHYNDKIFILHSNAQLTTNFSYSGKSISIANNSTVIFKMKDNEWYSNKDQMNAKNNAAVTYATGFWSTVLPYNWIEPGLKLVLEHNDQSSYVSGLTVGAPSELLMHTIDIGMLVESRNQFDFQNSKELQRQYFQTIPVSRLIVSQYLPVHLEEVRLPDNRLLTDFDPSEGGWHTGVMRGLIGKQLISIGINNANYGINSSIGEGESQNPYYAAQLTAHNSRGNYSNGIIIHGGSGGAGMVTLENTIGNEFSHEVGHNFGLGHYVGGFQGTVHKDASHANSTWGWDMDTHLFIPNFYAAISNQETCLNGECIAPFHGRQFGKDAMGGGSPTTNSRYTLYSPHSMKKIQHFLERKLVFDSNSPTGFWRWDSINHQKTFTPLAIDLESKTLGQDNSTQSDIEQALALNSLVRISYADGNWRPDIRIPPATQLNKDKIINLTSTATYSSNIHINNTTLLLTNSIKYTFYSNGAQWVHDDQVSLTRNVKPSQFGVPVVTLVGYYDPEQIYQTTLYPALFGNYGFTYTEQNQNSLCTLSVTIKNNQTLIFDLLSTRQKADRMNKLHVNIAQTDEPSMAIIHCNNTALDTLSIPQHTALPPVNVFGVPL